MNSVPLKLKRRDYQNAREYVWVANYGDHIEDRTCNKCGREVRMVTTHNGYIVLDQLSRRKTAWGVTARDHRQLCLKYKALG